MPVMVTHLGSMHLKDTIASIYLTVGCIWNKAILKSGKDTCCLEHRTRLKQVRNSMVSTLIVVAKRVTVKVHHCLNIASSYFHYYSHTCIGIILDKLFLQRTLCKILNAYINGCNDIFTVNGCCIANIDKLIQHLTSMLDTRSTSKYGIVGKLKSCVCLTCFLICRAYY